MFNFIANTLAKAVFVYTSWYGFNALFWVTLQ